MYYWKVEVEEEQVVEESTVEEGPIELDKDDSISVLERKEAPAYSPSETSNEESSDGEVKEGTFC